MKSRILLGALLIVFCAAGTRASSTRQWTIVNFVNAVQVKGALVMGPVLIVHDDVKMAKGEPCTTFYRFDRVKGPQEELVSFHCRPAQRTAVDSTLLTVVSNDPGCKKLVEYQIAGDSEGHGVPDK